MFMRRRSLIAFGRRVLTTASAALVLALAVFAASPGLHAKLHATDNGHDDGCVISLFAAGTPVPVGSVCTVPAVAELRAPRATVADEILVSEPHYLRHPERGPPGVGLKS